MRLRERIAFTWFPPEALRAFDCAIITDRARAQSSAFAVTFVARGADGGEVAPTGEFWPFSSSLDAYFQYSPESTDSPALTLRRWVGESPVVSVRVEVVGWLKDEEAPDALAMAFSAADEAEASARTWSLIQPKLPAAQEATA
ncbi:hypothetical protein ACXET9_09350 [Brachybacterium sp. DNPG3]